ncbi:MAG: cbb3-type cytochrome c oxidase N-terminal domain-containing protein [Parvibaculum sp.]|nr:cbb3-type cytochrome c oxidase N-terminal domain-containing protein [Parvibaculum sp.]
MSDHKHKDEVTGVETTGHDWDGIRELNNPLPKWWLYTFYICIVWSFAYWVVMPAWPYLSGGAWTYTTGVIGYEQRNVVTNELAAIAEGRSETMLKIASMPLEEVASDPALMEVALGAGKAAFGDNCAPCHGAEGKGNRELGAPDLSDHIWLYGGDRADIVQTVSNGRSGVMPAWGGRLGEGTINALTLYVHSLGGGE